MSMMAASQEIDFLLPKGIVVNSSEIEQWIERIQTPFTSEEIAKFWTTYTTTTRRLQDPTAKRLENLWWRIWSSDRQKLQGATIAALFAYISEENAFVQLKGPSNRFEGESRRGSPPTVENGTVDQSKHGVNSSPQAPIHLPADNKVAAQPAAIHPILKKSRGPSTTGPKLTARFVSPDQSEDEARIPDGGRGKQIHPAKKSSISPATAGWQVPPGSVTGSPGRQQQLHAMTNGSGEARGHPPTPIKKKPQGFVASAGKKRRPVLGRRQSSGNTSHAVTARSPDRSSGVPATSISMRQASTLDSVMSRRSHALAPDAATAETLQVSALTARKGKMSSLASGKPPSQNPSHDDRASPEETRPVQARNAQTLKLEEAATLQAETEMEGDCSCSFRISTYRGPSIPSTAQSHTPLSSTPQKSPSTTQDQWSEVLRHSRRSKSDGSLATMRLLPNRNQAKSRASLAPTLASALGQLGIPDSCALEEDIGTVAPLVTRPDQNQRLADGPAFVKRLGSFSKTSIPSTISEEPGGIAGPSTQIRASAPCFQRCGSDDHGGSLRMNRSITRLALLLEKDAVNSNNRRVTSDSRN